MTAYQWRKDSTVLAGESRALLSFSPLTVSDAGQYTCEVTVDNGTFIDTQDFVIGRKK